MRVNNYQSGSIDQSNETQGTQKSDRARKLEEARKKANTSELANTNGDVKTDVSIEAKEHAKAFEVAKSAADVREAKIAELKRRIANKEYNVKPEDVADKLVDEHINTSSKLY